MSLFYVVHLQFIPSYMNIQDIHVCEVHVEQYKLCLYFMLFTYDFFCFTWRSKVYGFVQVYKFSPSLLYIWYWFFTVAVLYIIWSWFISCHFFIIVLILPSQSVHLIYSPDSSMSWTYIYSWFIQVTILYMILILPRIVKYW